MRHMLQLVLNLEFASLLSPLISPATQQKYTLLILMVFFHHPIVLALTIGNGWCTVYVQLAL
jgi:hypothetical protein